MDVIERLSFAVACLYDAAIGDCTWITAFDTARDMMSASEVALIGLPNRNLIALPPNALGAHGVEVVPAPGDHHAIRLPLQQTSGPCLGQTGPSLVFTRAPHLPPFSDHERLLAATLLPHIRRSLELATSLVSLQMECGDLSGILDATAPKNALILSADRTILHASACMRHLLQQGGMVRSIGGKFSLAQSASNKAIARYIAEDEPKFEISTGSGESRVLLKAKRLAGLPGRPGSAYLVVIAKEAAAANPSSDTLRKAYGLTAAETRVLEALVAGGSRETVATELGLGLSTVKTHLQNLYAKTGVNRQAQLVRIAMQGPGGSPSSQRSSLG